MNKENSKLKEYRKKLAIDISKKIQDLLYCIEDEEDEKIVMDFWRFLDKWEK